MDDRFQVSSEGRRASTRLPSRSHHGFSLIEILMASVVGLLSVLGLLYLYKAQHRNMTVQSGIADMRMNGRFTLDELQYYLAHAGLGLPSSLRNIAVAGGDLVVRSNPSKKSSPAALDPGSTSTRTIFRIPRADTALFAGRAYAAAHSGGAAVEAPIRAVGPRPGVPSQALVTLERGRDDFPASATLYPVDRVRLHRCTGLGADTAAGEFKVVVENPGLRPGLRTDSLALAEGIERIAYRYFLINRDSADAPPANLDSLQRIEIKVVAKSLVRNRAAAGDGFARQTLTARVSYRRSL